MIARFSFYFSHYELMFRVKVFNPKKARGIQFDPPRYGFPKNEFFRKRVKPCFFVTFNIFLENVLEISQVIQKIWAFFSSLSIIFINFLGFFDIFLLQRN